MNTKKRLLSIGIKIGLFFFLFTVVIGIYPCKTVLMEPAFQGNDLLIYYRLSTSYHVSDAIIYQGQLKRVIAKEGDTVKIDSEGIKINGYLQKNLLRYQSDFNSNSKEFTLQIGEYFVMNDSEDDQGDLDCEIINKKDIQGQVILLIRTTKF